MNIMNLELHLNCQYEYHELVAGSGLWAFNPNYNSNHDYYKDEEPINKSTIP